MNVLYLENKEEPSYKPSQRILLLCVEVSHIYMSVVFILNDRVLHCLPQRGREIKQTLRVNESGSQATEEQVLFNSFLKAHSRLPPCLTFSP